MKLLYEGKAKRLYETETAHKLPREFKDDATTFDGQKKALLDHRGRLNKALSMLEKEGVPTHFLRGQDDIHMIVQLVESIKVEVVAHNAAAGPGDPKFARLSTDPTTISLADEITPDTCRLWDVKTGEQMDKDRFRRDLGDVMENDAEVLKRAEHAADA